MLSNTLLKLHDGAQVQNMNTPVLAWWTINESTFCTCKCPFHDSLTTYIAYSIFYYISHTTIKSPSIH